MQLNWKTAHLAALLLAMALLGAGCSGINTSQSVSPATFLIPGFFGQTPPAAPASNPVPPPASEPAVSQEAVQGFTPAN